MTERYGIGIDTGSVTTKAILLKLDTAEIAGKALSLTTHYDYRVCVNKALEKLIEQTNVKRQSVKQISLSTTLATNAILEGKSRPVGCIIIGWRPEKEIPAEVVKVVKGGHTVAGDEKESLDEKAIVEAVKETNDRVEAYVISAYFSVRNNEHELRAKEIIKKLTDKPIVCSYELTADLGLYERTVTAIFNAGLTPILKEFLDAVKITVNKLGLGHAKLFVVKGDGSLMQEAVARDRPVETILTGPAASAIGAKILSGKDRALIIDTGGTSTDIAILEKGMPRINQAGSLVGGYRTKVKAVDMVTVGLGGDSEIVVTPTGRVKVGPRRVFPLAYMGYKHPEIIDKMKDYEITSFYIVNEGRAHLITDEVGGKLLDAIRSFKLACLPELRNVIPEIDFYIGRIENYIKRFILFQAKVTPTDIFHVEGIFTDWSMEAAKIGVKLKAKEAKLSVNEFIKKVREEIIRMYGHAIMKKFIVSEAGEEEHYSPYLIEKALFKKGESFDCTLKLNMPIIGIGAPAKAVGIGELAKILNTGVIYPAYYEVGTAVGAIFSKIVERVEVLIRWSRDGGFSVHGPFGRKILPTLEEAQKFATEEGKKIATELAIAAGAEDVRIEIKGWEAAETTSFGEVFIGMPITIIARGKPRVR